MWNIGGATNVKFPVTVAPRLVPSLVWIVISPLVDDNIPPVRSTSPSISNDKAGSAGTPKSRSTVTASSVFISTVGKLAATVLPAPQIKFTNSVDGFVIQRIMYDLQVELDSLSILSWK